MKITSEHIKEFSTNGAILLKGAFSEFVEDVQNAIEENIKNPSWRERTYNPDDGGQAFFQDYVVWNKFDGYRNLVKNSKMASIAAKLMNSSTARIFHDHILVKEPGNSVVTPWHQDQPYYLCEGEQTISFGSLWIIFHAKEPLSILQAPTLGVKISNPKGLMVLIYFKVIKAKLSLI